MAGEITNSILQRIKQPDLLRILSEDLSGTELNSLLLEVFNKKTDGLTPPDLLNLYQNNRFVKPADLPVLETKQMELDLLRLFDRFSFTPIELSPVTVTGACSAVGPADQKKILSALRGTEVLADSTNAIALHVSDLKQRKIASGEIIRFSNIQRQLRTQTISVKGFTPHFKIGCLVSCGKDTGDFQFEKICLNEHFTVMKALFMQYYKMEKISFRLLKRSGYPDHFIGSVCRYLQEQNPDEEISLIENPEKHIGYYKGIQYKVDIQHGGKSYEIADGGFVDWTQQLLQNKKERMLTTGFGFDLMHRILSEQI